MVAATATESAAAGVAGVAAGLASDRRTRFRSAGVWRWKGRERKHGGDNGDTEEGEMMVAAWSGVLRLWLTRVGDAKELEL